MRVPSYTSNREADEDAMETTAKAGRCVIRMRPSRETCLHREISSSGARKSYGAGKASLAFLREGRFFFDAYLLLIHLIKN